MPYLFYDWRHYVICKAKLTSHVFSCVTVEKAWRQVPAIMPVDSNVIEKISLELLGHILNDVKFCMLKV